MLFCCTVWSFSIAHEIVLHIWHLYPIAPIAYYIWLKIFPNFYHRLELLNFQDDVHAWDSFLAHGPKSCEEVLPKFRYTGDYTLPKSQQKLWWPSVFKLNAGKHRETRKFDVFCVFASCFSSLWSEPCRSLESFWSKCLRGNMDATNLPWHLSICHFTVADSNKSCMSDWNNRMWNVDLDRQAPLLLSKVKNFKTLRRTVPCFVPLLSNGCVGSFHFEKNGRQLSKNNLTGAIWYIWRNGKFVSFGRINIVPTFLEVVSPSMQNQHVACIVDLSLPQTCGFLQPGLYITNVYVHQKCIKWYQQIPNPFWLQVPWGNLCGDKQSAKATFHHNRFSCEVPASISNASDVHATVVMGNMVGHGYALNASWISAEENQAFLYYSPKVWRDHMSIGFSMRFLLLFSLNLYAPMGRIFSRNLDAKGKTANLFAVKPRFLMSTVLTLGLCVVLFQKQLPGEKFHPGLGWQPWPRNLHPRLQRRLGEASRSLGVGNASRVAASNLALLRIAACHLASKRWGDGS